MHTQPSPGHPSHLTHPGHHARRTEVFEKDGVKVGKKRPCGAPLPPFPPLLLCWGGGGEGGRTPLGSLQGRDPATQDLRRRLGLCFRRQRVQVAVLAPETRFPFSGHVPSLAVEQALALQTGGMRRGSRVLLAASQTVSSASCHSLRARAHTHTHTHTRVSIYVCALASGLTWVPASRCTHITHTHTATPSLGASLAPVLAFSWALLRAPRAATKCESPARAGEPAWSREESTGDSHLLPYPCPALKLTITFGGRLGLFFFF